MMKSKNGLFLPSVAEIVDAILETRRVMIFFPETETVLAFDCESGTFCQYETQGEYWENSADKPIIPVDYRKPIDAREIAREFRKNLARVYSSGAVAKKNRVSEQGGGVIAEFGTATFANE